MTQNRSFVDLNRASTDRMRTLVAELSDAQLQQPLGEHWTVAIALAHLAFWDLRVVRFLETAEETGTLAPPAIDVSVNDICLPLWAAIPPRQAARMAVKAASALDERLARLSPELLAELDGLSHRWVVRALHRGDHLDEIDAALGR